MQCPKCSVEMDEVRKLDVIVDTCAKCGGIWLDRGELDKLRESANEIRHEHARAQGHAPDRVQPHVYGHGNGHGHAHGHSHGHGHGHGKHKRKKNVFELLDIFD